MRPARWQATAAEVMIASENPLQWIRRVHLSFYLDNVKRFRVL